MALSDNLVSYWKLDESSGNAADSVGSNTLTNENSVGYAAALINNGADFGTANTNKSLYSANNLALSGSHYTFSCWVKLSTELTTVGGLYMFLESFDDTNIYTAIYYRNVSGETRAGGWRNGGVNGLTEYATALGTTNWHFLVVTYDGTNVTFYLDNVQRGTPAAASGNNPGAYINSIEIGADGASGDNRWYSSTIIDECGVWSRDLTTTEISQLYNGGAGLQYPFTSTGTTAHNLLTLGIGT